jgi:hypothetical protein
MSTSPFVRKIVTAQTGDYRFDVVLIDEVTVKNDLVYGDFEGFTFEYADEEMEYYRNKLDDEKWTRVVRIDRDENGPVAYSISVRTDTITYRRIS